MNGAREETLLLQRRQSLHQVGYSRIVGCEEKERAKCLRLGHEPETHAGDDSKIRLRKNSIEEGTYPVPKHPPGPRLLEVPKSGFEYPAIRKHNLKATERLKVVAVSRMSEAAIESVSYE